ncbi:hypothetical protein P153DRAFT_354332 [Dothidotthia symphoricarpi CBS 119687]|uniref:HCP-like protein n=1 Tax=Dothidotthia symphoricarpi CBS 119687 TaxID=1392245 RepID=A0A6A6APT7_9PLEO|nr:uncharacterized protein P153DRAFT_354332 [Dothidotthia symphoricarpi CBS 119687]KAF2132887.1 hypothetical protein P153DRAFT_354332 [Dothidotthia symphoricarpi CBS 119687]
MARPYRPGGLEFRSQSFDPSYAGIGSSAGASASSLSLADIPSPQAGEVPPALSPLDALALQGRLLAKRFEQADRSGRRLSRLAPLTIQNEFGHRPGYFTSLSNSALNSPNDDLCPPNDQQAPASPGRKPQVSPRQVQAPERHKSFMGQFGGDEMNHLQSPHMRMPLASIGEISPAGSPQGYFDIPRSRSPEAAEHHIDIREATPVSPTVPGPTSRMFLSPQRNPSSDSQPRSPRSRPQANLLPPRSSSSLHSQRSPRQSPSIRSVQDSSDEVEDMSLSASFESLQPNRSRSPSFRAQSPFTRPAQPPLARSTSQSSEYSVGGSYLPRPSFNFSRPMSRQSQRPSVDVRPPFGPPSRQPSEESVNMRVSYDTSVRLQEYIDSPTTNYHNETVHTPVSMVSEDCFRRSGDFTTNPVPSYTYSKFDLPRGRKLDRKSVGAEDFLNDQITWDQPNQKQARPPSPESPPRSFESSRSQQQQQQQSTPARDAALNRGAPSLTSSNSTIRGPSTTVGAEVTAQEHCDKGVELHEAGELLKSTYHLRLAARAGLPEAMFWYGLACRHGWGMRENKSEALTWLRRAVDSGHLEVADDEDQSRHGRPIDIVKKKQHRARYGVAIYELGKCYMNGWGAAQDKTLALRCYEIAGNWGDADALVEAGYCYAEGVGCRKDMKKAAKFYRAAEEKGVSMVGNSWIYKDKYMDDFTASDSRSVRSGRSAKKDNSEKKARDKSRTRALFSRKKSGAASPMPH